MATQRPDRLTIHDIAALAGVSAGTVSRTLNGQPGVGSATRERIMQIVTERGYKIDAAARQLSTGRSRTIGIVFPLQVSEVVIHPVYPVLLGSLGDAAQERLYDIMMFTVSSPERIGHVINSVEEKRVDGVVLPAAGSRDPLVRQLSERRTPVVLIGHRVRSGSVGWVDCTHDQAAAEFTSSMIAHQRRRLVMLNGPAHVSAFRLRARGFWDAVEGSGAPVAAEEISIEMDARAAFETAHELLAGPNRPDGIVCASDDIAGGVLDAARSLGVNVPTDLEVTGFDDSAFAVHTTPPLSTVRMPLQDIGRAAIELLVKMIEAGDEVADRHITLPTTLIHRGSTSSDTTNPHA